jgi:hypothetical protein
VVEAEETIQVVVKALAVPEVAVMVEWELTLLDLTQPIMAEVAEEPTKPLLGRDTKA